MSPRTEIIENVIGVESLFSPSVNRCGRATRKSSVGSKQPYSLHSAAGRLERVSKIGPESPQDGEERSPAAAARRPFAARGGGMEEEGREGTFSLSRTPNQYRGCVRVCVCVCRGAGRRLPARLSASFSGPLCRGRSAGQGGFGGRLHFPVLCACTPGSPIPGCLSCSLQAERACYVSSSVRESRACWPRIAARACCWLRMRV